MSFMPGKRTKDGRLKQPTYGPGRTKQSYKNETDINKIMARADKAGTISHLQKFEGVYGDFSDTDFHGMTQKLTQGREIFDELPAELRQEFGQSPAAFFAYVNDPKNVDNLREKLPSLAAPGKQVMPTKPPTADEAASAAASDVVAETTTPTPTSEVASSTLAPTG